MLSHIIPQFLVTDRIPIKLQLTGKSRLIFKIYSVTALKSYVRLLSTLHTCNKLNAESIFCNTTQGLQSIYDTIIPWSTEFKHFLQNHYQHQQVGCTTKQMWRLNSTQMLTESDLREQNIHFLWMCLQH